MKVPDWTVHLVSLWVLVNSLAVSAALVFVLRFSHAGGFGIPEAASSLVTVCVVGFVLFRKVRGARVVATCILGWTSLNALIIFASGLNEATATSVTTYHMIVALAYLVLNTCCFLFLWRGRSGNPYGHRREPPPTVDQYFS